MAKPARGLGKGLSALLGETTGSEQLRQPVGYVNKEIVGARGHQDTSDILRIPMDMIEPNPYQPRLTFSQEALEELSASIKNLGLIQPITVRKLSDTQFQIISGERRYKACRLAGMTMIPAYVRDTNDRGMIEMAIVENIQRENLDPIEEALSYQRLIDECGLTQEEMADRVGKKRATVSNQLRLLKLPLRIQHDLKVGILSVGHAKVILGIEDANLQQQLCDWVVREEASVRELEKKVHEILETSAEKKPSARRNIEIPQEYNAVKQRIGKFFSNEIAMSRTSTGHGTLTIKFSSDEEVRTFLKALEDSGI